MNKKSVNKRKRRVTRRHVANRQKGGTLGFVRESTYHDLKNSFDQLQRNYNDVVAKLKHCEDTETQRLSRNAHAASTFDDTNRLPPPTQPKTVNLDFKFIKKLNTFAKMKIVTSSESSLSSESSVMNYNRNTDRLAPATPIQKNIYTEFKSSGSTFKLDQIVTVIDQDCNIVGFVKKPNISRIATVDKLELLFYDVNSKMYIVLFEMNSGSDGVSVNDSDIANALKQKYFTGYDNATIIFPHFRELE